VILEKEYATEGSPATAASAGVVGGLLATVATKSSPATAGTETHYYHYDANGNVTETIDSYRERTALKYLFKVKGSRHRNPGPIPPPTYRLENTVIKTSSTK